MRKALVRQRTSAMKMFAAPTSGWIANQNLAISAPKSLQGAEVLENFFPTATGIEVRRGSSLYATLGGGDMPVTAIFDYNNGNNKHLFASTATTIYDITVVSSPMNYRLSTGSDEIVTDGGDYIGQLSTGGLERVTGLSGGDWITTQIAMTGGIYLVAVNGQDPMHVFDGEQWFPIDDGDIYMLLYDTETAPFVENETLTGGTSGATASIVHVEDSGTTGVLYITDVVGTFQNNEIISSASGSATADGTPQPYYVGITGVDTRDLSYVWTYKNRLWFIKKESMNAWYLPIDNIGGVATSFPMGGEFSEGGKLLIGTSWSLDTSGDGGLSEQCVFISDEGQVVAYQGLSPATAATWSRVGGYKIGKPLGPLAWIRAGGDFIVATDIGHVPLSQAVNRDIAALSPVAVSYPIETSWNQAVDERRSLPWHCVVWPERQMAIVAPQSTVDLPPVCFVANARTGAWSNFTNWNIRCLCVYDGRLFFGSDNGRVVEAYVTGMDEEVPFTATVLPLFNDLGSPASLKSPKIARAVTRGSNDINIQLSIMRDYIVSMPSPPDAASLATDAVWGGAVWGQSQWSGTLDKKIQQAFTSVSGLGYSLSIGAQITSGSIIPLDTELIRLEMTYESTDIIA